MSNVLDPLTVVMQLSLNLITASSDWCLTTLKVPTYNQTYSSAYRDIKPNNGNCSHREINPCGEALILSP